jgi:pyruvate kinase
MTNSSFRRTKIVATIGPATAAPEMLRSLLEAGVDVFRLNFSHGDHESMLAIIRDIREISRAEGRPSAILQDLQGPKVRVGPLTVPEVRLIDGQRVRIYGDARPGHDDVFSVVYEELARDLQPGNLIFINDGLIELRAVDVAPDHVEAEVVIGGHLRARQGVNFPGVELKMPSVTEKDRADLVVGLEAGVDLVALSFVRRPEDALPVREIFHEHKVNPPLIAKIERREALDAIDEVVDAFDGVMVARGDLAIDLRPEKVPTAQKQIIRTALAQGKPVITATQMLESMTYNTIPTRAEASDVANAVFDGTDAVMLSAETATGSYPLETVRTMDRIVREAESLGLGPLARPELPPSTMYGFCAAAVQLAKSIGASAIAALTRTGENARILAALRPEMPIIALCEDESLVHTMNLWHAVLPLQMGHTPAIEEASATIRREIALRGLLPTGSQVVVVGVSPGSETGRTDFIRLIAV